MLVGTAQGRKPDDECHRLRRGRENLQGKLFVTESLPFRQNEMKNPPYALPLCKWERTGAI